MTRLSAAVFSIVLVAASIAATTAVILWPAHAAAQSLAAQAPVAMDRKAATQVLDALDAALNSYVFPETARAIQTRLKARRADYLKLPDRSAFAAAVTADMRDAGHDLHLNLRPDDLAIAARGERPTVEQERALDQAQGYGFTDARRLPGNVGYLNLRNFGDEDAWPMIDAAMTLLQHTDALIIDLRANTGGSIAISRLLGHLSRDDIPMQTLYWRRPDGGFDSVVSEVSRPASGALYPDRPVYVLISNRTFSAAEAFSYNIKAAHRATLVGEKTRGGGNPSNRPVLPGWGLSANIPNGRVEHSVTRETWEGIGVAPDVETRREDALLEAYKLALAAAQPRAHFETVDADRRQALADPAKAVAGL